MLLDPADLRDLSAGDTLVELEIAVRRRRAVEVDDLLLCLRWADLHDHAPHHVSGDRGPVIPGGERLTGLGGEGTPRVRELALCELGIARGVHTNAARSVLADALDLRHRLPLTWAQVQTLDAEAWVARKVAAQSRHLSAAAIGVVDAAVAAAITGQSPARVLDLAAAKIIEADQVAHDQRLDAERRRRYVGVSRSDETGLRTVIARVTAGDAHWVDATITRVADILTARDPGSDLSADELRAEAFGWLARPVELLMLLLEHGDQCQSRATALPADLLDALRNLDLSALRPRATLYAHLHEAALTGTNTGGVARVEGLAPMSLAALRDLLARTSLVVKPVIDLRHRVSTNAYEHPESIRERIHLLRPGDQFPHATRTTRTVDLDHPVPYQPDGPPGQTSSHTSQPLTRTAHRAKTHLGYHSTPLPTGEILWQTPLGLTRLVDASGTHTVDPTDWSSNNPIDQALTRIHHHLHTGQLESSDSPH